MTAEQCEMIRLESMEEYGFGPEVMKRTKICEKCGSSTSAENDRCQKCGSDLPSETVFEQYKKRHEYCPTCDTVVSADKQYCPQCGQKI